MPLHEAENSDASLRGATHQLIGALEVRSYVLNPHQAFSNIDSDPLVPDFPEAGSPASRLELLGYVLPHRADQSALASSIVGFSRAHCAQGPVVGLATNRILGRVQGLSALADSISGPTGTLSLSHAKALVRDLALDASDITLKLASQKLALTGKALSRHQVWAFPVSDTRQPFAEIGNSRAEAVNALGLGCYAVEQPHEELVRWSHQLPDSLSARRPTVWDASCSLGNVYWCPWGKTCQLSTGLPGVTEVIHPPIHGEDLVHPFEILT